MPIKFLLCRVDEPPYVEEQDVNINTIKNLLNGYFLMRIVKQNEKNYVLYSPSDWQNHPQNRNFFNHTVYGTFLVTRVIYPDSKEISLSDEDVMDILSNLLFRYEIN